MPQKILGGRCADPLLRGDLVDVKVDQVVLTRQPNRALDEALSLGMKKCPVELSIAYDGVCVTTRARVASMPPSEALSPELMHAGLFVARPGIGFPAPVHLERFAAPARLAITDDPRLASLGGIGMLVFVASPGQLGQALAFGTVSLRPPRSIQILLSGRLRPFVCARDVTLELLRRGLADVVRRVESQHQAPVVLEFAGPSARLLSVPERAVLCGIAPQVGAAAALFVSDEKTEVFLRDQRRSKAHRALAPDAGAPCDDVVSIDLGATDPLVCDETGRVRPVRDLAGQPVGQVVLGGDAGATLRDMLAAATLLKSKRIPPQLDFIVAPPSRQVLEVLGQAGALVDLIATGARLVEPDWRVLTGELYPPPAGQLSLRTSDPDPVTDKSASFVLASAETLAYSVATGAVGDPRSFKRPVRVTVPRALPTDDVLVVRERRSDAAAKRSTAEPVAPPTSTASCVSSPFPWKSVAELELVEGMPHKESNGKNRALLLSSLDEVRSAAARLSELTGVRAVIAPYIPSGLVPLFAGAGVLALGADTSALSSLKGQTSIALGPIGAPNDSAVTAMLGKSKIALSWLAVGPERGWTLNGTSRPNTQPRSR